MMKRKSNLIGTVALLTMLLLSGCGESQDRIVAEHTRKTTKVATTTGVLPKTTTEVETTTEVTTAQEQKELVSEATTPRQQQQKEVITEEIPTQRQTEMVTTQRPTEMPTTEQPTTTQAPATQQWTEPVTYEPVKETISTGKRNAVQAARDYLQFSNFSASGLYGQLQYEGYSDEESQYGVDNCGANWNEQAVDMAKDYLDYSNFSYTGLYNQLIYEKFSENEAIYGVNN